MENKREAWIQFEILRAWGAHDAVFMWRQNTGAAVIGNRLVRFGLKGAPDIFSVVAPSGKLVVFETKTEEGRQSPAQKAWQARVESVGGLYVLARDLEIADFTYASLGIYR